MINATHLKETFFEHQIKCRLDPQIFKVFYSSSFALQQQLSKELETDEKHKICSKVFFILKFTFFYQELHSQRCNLSSREQLHCSGDLQEEQISITPSVSSFLHQDEDLHRVPGPIRQRQQEHQLRHLQLWEAD